MQEPPNYEITFVRSLVSAALGSLWIRAHSAAFSHRRHPILFCTRNGKVPKAVSEIGSPEDSSVRERILFSIKKRQCVRKKKFSLLKKIGGSYGSYGKFT